MLRVKTGMRALAPAKTELLPITGKHIPLNAKIKILTEEMTTQISIKCLGPRLGSRLNFYGQLKHATNRASKVSASLSRLIANIITEQKETYGFHCTIDSAIWKRYFGRFVTERMQKKKYCSVQPNAAIVIAIVLVISRMILKERENKWSLRRSRNL